ncbi:MAG: ABC transporter ATP-binding protein [Candidatus Rokubacteria bacterium]|nr:ABC transporter ATP-binding protein [Candidatus Rokubacteria bacterium]
MRSVFTIRKLDKTFVRERNGRLHETEALREVALEIAEGEFVCLLGPSGCGKTTLLQIMAGLEFPTGGTIEYRGQPILGPDTSRGFIFQRFNLFPWLTALENVKFGLRLKGLPQMEQNRTALEKLRMVRLVAFKDHYPRELSGGMQQRVSLARTLAIEPDVYLMDEPFGSLDAQTRRQMQQELIALWQETELRTKTIVFVTHDITEAVLLGDRIVLLTARPGTVKEIVRVDVPRPRDPFDPQLVALARTIVTNIQEEIDKALREELEARTD